jgi:hypothetical protein
MLGQGIVPQQHQTLAQVRLIRICALLDKIKKSVDGAAADAAPAEFIERYCKASPGNMGRQAAGNEGSIQHMFQPNGQEPKTMKSTSGLYSFYSLSMPQFARILLLIVSAHLTGSGWGAQSATAAGSDRSAQAHPTMAGCNRR